MSEPNWIDPDLVFEIHQKSIERYGGSAGIRDRGAIESALARPPNLLAYGEPDLFDLAAAYTAGIAQNRGFVDGNKRSAYLTGIVFFEDNGITLNTEQAEVVVVMVSLATHRIDEAGYAQWLRDHSHVIE